MHGGIVVTEDQAGEKRTLNKSKPEINRGVELLLRNRRKRSTPKTFEVKFSFFNKEITFSLDIKKK